MISMLFSCHHATCAVPEAYREVFRGSEDVLTSSEGWEPGALNLAQGFSMKFRTPLVHGDVTRLLIDLEKNGDERWSRFTGKLPEATRLKIADRHERPYRATLKQRVLEEFKRDAKVLHVLIHAHRETDGRVFLDTWPGATDAAAIASNWCAEMRKRELDASRSETLGTEPLLKDLAAEFPRDNYLQIRLSVSQSFFLEGRPLRWETAKKIILDTLSLAMPGDS